MKNPKRLTLKQKICVSAHGLNVKNWMFVEETEFYYKIINKETQLTKHIDKFRRKR